MRRIDSFTLIRSLLAILMVVCILSDSRAQTSGKTHIKDTTHFSNVLHQVRNYRIFLPPGYYANSGKRYPVIYHFHGFCGRYNGPLVPVDGIFYEGRYYDEFNGDHKRCGPDSLDNIAEFVRTNDVIVVKWDGYVPEHYPRPYNLAGEFIDAVLKKKSKEVDLQFINYFPEFVQHIDATYRTLANRNSRAVSGLSMGGFMSLYVASKYPHLISSASFFSPSVGFYIGPEALKVSMSFSDLAMNYVGLPIRMHLGSKDFLRQRNQFLDHTFKNQELDYESWHYGVSYSGGFHDMVNIEDQYNFHMKYFRSPPAKPEKWHHIDVYPDFDVWNYTFSSNRNIPGFTVVEDVTARGLKLTAREWLPDGRIIPNVQYTVKTDAIYRPQSAYELLLLDIPSKKITRQQISSDDSGTIAFPLTGRGTDVGIYAANDAGFLSMASYKTDVKMPRAWQTVTLTPLFFNKGGKKIDSVSVDLISLDDDIEVMTSAQIIAGLNAGSLHDKTSFKLRSRSALVDHAKLKVIVNYNGINDKFLLDIPFFSPEKELKTFEIADGRKFEHAVDGNQTYGKGNANGVVNPGEYISIVTRAYQKDTNWYPLQLTTTDRFVDMDKSVIRYVNTNDGSGATDMATELFIKPDCPAGHIITVFGRFEHPKPGNPERDSQGSLTNLHETKRYSIKLTVGGKK